ncbi:hypothetical protein [Myxosarcina sp. GI1]|uniref:hypothetical protein n=1 Tax=Myxosarcina sp. GI1 TaxID=1541065 RepID=UPI00055B6410|nr:hypothetical protein [Myxosarcina sp. GI1]
MTLPKLSELYYALIKIKNDTNSSELIEEAESINRSYLDDVRKFNDLTQELINNIDSNDSEKIIELLVYLRIWTMNINSAFYNLTDVLTEVIIANSPDEIEDNNIIEIEQNKDDG